jgi:hypothetical protein
MNYTYYFDYKPEEKFCLIYTFKCSAACGHCIIKSNTSREEKLSYETAREIIKVSSQNNKKAVILSGGEVFLYFTEILNLTKYATECNLDVLIETNGFWAKDITETKRKLSLLKENGLKIIFVSFDYFHSKFIQFDNIKRIMNISKEIGLKSEVMFTRSNKPDEDETILENLHREGYTFFEDDLLPFGRASDMFDDCEKVMFDSLDCCDSLTTTFMPNGDAFSCCNINDENTMLKRTPMYLGNLNQENMQQIFDREKTNRFLDVISDKEKMVDFMKFIISKGLNTGDSENRYVSICDLCLFISSDPECRRALKEYLISKGDNLCV